jgi:hypothetical protein
VGIPPPLTPPPGGDCPTKTSDSETLGLPAESDSESELLCDWRSTVCLVNYCRSSPAHSRIRVPRNSLPYFSVSDSRFSQLDGPGPRIYISQELGGPAITPDTWFHFVASYDSQGYGGGIRTSLHVGFKRFGRSVKLLLDLASSVIPVFSLLDIHDEDFYSLLDVYVFRNGVSSSTKEGSVFLRRCYACCTVFSARIYPRSQGQITIESQRF